MPSAGDAGHSLPFRFPGTPLSMTKVAIRLMGKKWRIPPGFSGARTRHVEYSELPEKTHRSAGQGRRHRGRLRADRQVQGDAGALLFRQRTNTTTASCRSTWWPSLEAAARFPHVTSALADLRGITLSYDAEKRNATSTGVNQDVVALAQRFAMLMSEYNRRSATGRSRSTRPSGCCARRWRSSRCCWR
jgi:hypothetical protein